jgi:hypothetical protein
MPGSAGSARAISAFRFRKPSAKQKIRSAIMSLISVFTDQIRPDRVRRYEAIIAELAAEARKKREEWRWTAHQVGFGSLARIYYVSEHPDYADLEKHGDAPALFERVLGDKKGPKLLEEANECLVSNQRTLGVQRPDLSYVKEPAQGVAPLASLALFRARPGAQHLVVSDAKSKQDKQGLFNNTRTKAEK